MKSKVALMAVIGTLVTQYEDEMPAEDFNRINTLALGVMWSKESHDIIKEAATKVHEVICRDGRKKWQPKQLNVKTAE